LPAYLLQGLILGATAAAQPGPFQAFLLSLIARDGWRRTLPAALAPLISDGPIIVLVLLVLVQLPEWLLSVLQITGGVFLLFLAWGAWQAFRDSSPAIDGALPAIQGDVRSNILKASLMNFLSPSPYIFWATVTGPILIDAWRQAPTLGLAFLAGFYTALIGGLTLFIFVFAGASRIDPRMNRVLSAVSAIGLFAFALYQLVAGINDLRAMFI
jgi:threonine/homoserine/homoserine lactone efflux protein